MVTGHVYSSCATCSANKYTSALYMMTSLNGNIFGVAGPLWGEFTGHSSHKGHWGGAPMFSICRWFETPSCSSWRQCNERVTFIHMIIHTGHHRCCPSQSYRYEWKRILPLIVYSAIRCRSFFVYQNEDNMCVTFNVIFIWNFFYYQGPPLLLTWISCNHSMYK